MIDLKTSTYQKDLVKNILEWRNIVYANDLNILRNLGRAFNDDQ